MPHPSSEFPNGTEIWPFMAEDCPNVTVEIAAAAMKTRMTANGMDSSIESRTSSN
jgi:hypothetical protein